MRMSRGRERRERRRTSLLVAALVVLTAAALPQSPRIAIDPSIFEDDCIAPKGAEPRCSKGELQDPPIAPSASAALIAPEREAEPARRLLTPDWDALMNFGPELAYRVRQPRELVSGTSPRCVSRGRHRPDRAFCPKPSARTAAYRAGSVKVKRAP